MKISIFESYMDAAELLETDGERLAFYDAIFRYAFRGENPTLETKTLQIAWTIIKPFLDSSISGAKNGEKGGRPSKNEGLKGGVKTHSKTHKKTHPKTQYEYEEEEEGEGFRVFENSKTIPYAGGAGAVKAAPHSGMITSDVFAWVDENYPDHIAEQLEHRAKEEQLKAASVPCPPDIAAKVKGGAA